MALDKDTYRLTHIPAEQLLAYKDGKCTDRQMHAIEKHLLDCEICQDALEGFVQFDSAEIKSDLSRLSTRLQSKTEKKTPIWSYLGVAASVALLVTVGWLLYPAEEEPLALEKKQDEKVEESTRDQEEPSKELAEEMESIEVMEEVVEEINEPAPKPAAVSAKPQSSSRIVTQEETEEFDADEEIEFEEDIAFGAGADAFAEEEFADEQMLAMEAPKVEPEILEEVVVISYGDQKENEITGAVAGVEADQIDPLDKSSSKQAKAKGKAANEKERKKTSSEEELAENYRANMKATGAVMRASAPSTFFIYGQVTDSDDKREIPGVTVLVKNTMMGTVTDIDGYFELEVPDREGILVFSFIGYTTQEAAYEDESEMNVSLDVDVESLEEAVVIGYGTRRDSDGPSVIISPKPNGGYSAYKKQIKENLQYPEEALANEIEGRVRLKFNVSPGGKIRDIQVVKSLGYGCDEEAIRLVKELGKWNPGTTDGTNTEMPVTYTIRFKLP